ncbi:MAG TPA: hypothetical protein VIM57_03040 [Luteolibacter sp.]
MDKEHARFVLRCFRPDGADAGEIDFTTALELAAADRELGEWLARERADDAAFARALASAPVPEGLRDEILTGMAAARGDSPPVTDAFDGAFIGSLATLNPPGHLRSGILLAMERSAKPPPVVTRPLRWKRFALPVAAAAGIAVGLWVGDRPHATISAPVAKVSPPAFSRLPVGAVPVGFVRTYESPGFALEHTNRNHDDLFENLKTRDLPCPGCHCLPPGLKDVPALGCRELVIDGKRGSLLCFDQGENGIVHLLIFRRDDVEGDLPCGKHPRMEHVGRWETATWGDENDVFVLIGPAGKTKLETYF